MASQTNQTLAFYNGKSDPVEHVTTFNTRMAQPTLSKASFLQEPYREQRCDGA